MGEFVGIDPLGAEKLIRQMEAGKDVLARARPAHSSPASLIAASSPGREGVAAMHRSWAFFHESQQDLKWRIGTIKRIVPLIARRNGTFKARFRLSLDRCAPVTVLAVGTRGSRAILQVQPGCRRPRGPG